MHLDPQPKTRLRGATGLLILLLPFPIFLLFAGMARQEGAPAASSQTPPSSPAAEPAAEPAADPLAALGFHVTGGAAPGYVEDRACALCHNDLWRSYQAVGMSHSFARPRAETLFEDFEHSRFHHERSDRWYEIRRDGERLTFRRWQQDEEGHPIHVFERRIDWVLGSGHTSRVYLYQTEEGELYQLPLAWYSQNQLGEVTPESGHWGMAPGYDRPDHPGVLRQVRRECMFCHNAYPDVAAGSDLYGQPQVFPHELPEGTGCQRCHGPGAEHVRLAFGGAQDVEKLRAAIVNPARLPPALRNSVCYECHLQPTVVLNGVRRFDRADDSFRPGELLSDYLLKVDIDEEGQTRPQRFEINHHAYRLEQSRCFRESQGKPDALSCLTCHDPHRKVPPEQRAAHYRAACLTCHQPDDCKLDEMKAASGDSEAAGSSGTASVGAAPGIPAVDPQDCVGCHMPRHRSQDVVQVVMTDHLIRRQPGGPELVAPLDERDPVVEDVELLEPLEGPLNEVYRTVSVLRAGASSEAAIDHLAKALTAAKPAQLTPYLDLARGQIRIRRLPDAEATLREVLAKDPDNVWATSWLGIVEAGQGRRDEALASARKALALDPDRSELHFNLGRLLLGYGKPAEALSELERALELRPNLVAGWFQLGQVYGKLDRPSDADAAYRRALEIEPGYQRAKEALAAKNAGGTQP